jgi:hypothetical protein
MLADEPAIGTGDDPREASKAAPAALGGAVGVGYGGERDTGRVSVQHPAVTR